MEYQLNDTVFYLYQLLSFLSLRRQLNIWIIKKFNEFVMGTNVAKVILGVHNLNQEYKNFWNSISKV